MSGSATLRLCALQPPIMFTVLCLPALILDHGYTIFFLVVSVVWLGSSNGCGEQGLFHTEYWDYKFHIHWILRDASFPTTETTHPL